MKTAIGYEVTDMFEKTGIKDKVIEEIRDLARQYDVEKVILFGSRARGDYKERSDIDLAVSGGAFWRGCRGVYQHIAHV